MIQYDTLTVVAIKHLNEKVALMLKLLYVSRTVEATVTYYDFTNHYDARELVRELATPNSEDAVTQILMKCLACANQQAEFLTGARSC